ncbi:MAG: hypothetical protein ACRCYU_04500, partial [Nocardioides sp.]
MPVTAETIPSDLSLLLAAGDNLARGLAALSAAESLTDELALAVLQLADAPSWLLSAVHLTDLVMERNSEWNLVERARQPLLDELSDMPDIHSRVHALLHTIAADPASRASYDELPRYLVEGPGRAYHGAELSKDHALRRYADIAIHAPVRDQWLGYRLAQEQQRRQVIPSGAIEIAFLNGMLAYREGRRIEAIRLLRSVAADDRRRKEVAIAAHIVGRFDGRRQARRAEDLLRKSLDIGGELNNEFHQAQVLHTLGQLVGRDRKRVSEAEDLLRKSLDILEELGDEFSQAQVLHTLGQLVG